MNRAKRTIRHYFNMVEVALALAVVGIGIAGIMSLFPVALNANRQAVGDSYAPDVANQFLSYIQLQCNSSSTNWNTLVSSLPDSKPYINFPSEDDRTQNFNTNVMGNIYSPGATPAGLYNVRIATGTAPNEIVDFNAAIRIWKKYSANGDIDGDGTDETPAVPCSIMDLSIDGKTYDVPITYGVGVFIEISWPLEKPYNQRYKRNYYLEIFNQNS